MSLTLHPGEVIQAHRPPINWVVGSLTISNNNDEHVAFELHSKEMDTKNYIVFPQSGRIMPGGSVYVTIRCEVPPEDTADRKKFNDVFIIKSIVIPSTRHGLAHYDFWKNPEATRRKEDIYEHIFTVTFEEESESPGESSAATGKQDDLTLEKMAKYAIGMAHPMPNKEILHGLKLHEDKVQPIKPSEFPGEKRMRMPGVFFYPANDNVLYFQRPLTRPISRLLTITNCNPYPVAYRINTTNEELYIACPNFGRVGPGQNINLTIEKVPFQAEPPLDAICKDKISIQLANINPEQEALSVHDIFTNLRENNEPDFYHEFSVIYLPMVGLSFEELEKYSAGAAHLIPDELFNMYPTTALCFRRLGPWQRLEKLKSHVVITNISTHPLAFRIMLTPSENIKIYTVQPSSGKLDSGQHLRVKVVREPVEDEPTEEHPDIFQFQCTVIYPDEILEKSDIWQRAEARGAISQQKLPVMFIPSNGLTPEERLIDAQQGAFSRLMKEELDEHKKTTVNKPDQVQENDEAAQGLLTNAKDTSIRRWLLPITPTIVPKQPEP